jgi:fluoride exporter
MRRVLIVFLGGGIGSCLRAMLLAWLAPWGTTAPVLLANLLGAFALGMVFVLADEVGLLRAETRLFLAVGVLGGFTTFSTFAWGADLLFARHTTISAVAYLAASVAGGILAVAAGLQAARQLVLALERGAMALLRRLDEKGLRRTGSPGPPVDSIETEEHEVSA